MNLWGVFSFVLPVVASVIVGAIAILISTLSYLIKGVRNAKRD